MKRNEVNQNLNEKQKLGTKTFSYRKNLVPQASAHSSPHELHDKPSADAQKTKSEKIINICIFFLSISQC